MSLSSSRCSASSMSCRTRFYSRLVPENRRCLDVSRHIHMRQHETLDDHPPGVCRPLVRQAERRTVSGAQLPPQHPPRLPDVRGAAGVLVHGGPVSEDLVEITGACTSSMETKGLKPGDPL